MVSVMRIIDQNAIAQWNASLNIDKMRTISPIIETESYDAKQKYYYGPYPIRQYRVNSCAMHKVQICFEFCQLKTSEFFPKWIGIHILM